jgi:GNAT superfamily N-acetyltransferase
MDTGQLLYRGDSWRRGVGVGDAAVQSLRDEDVERASGVIARAFHDDALTVHLYPDDESRRRLAPSMFEALVRYDRLFGQVDHLPGFEAVATWVRPGETAETADRLAQAGFDDLPDGVPLEALDSFFGATGPAIASVAPGPHWHLRLLGVDPGHQGRGLGAALLRHGIDRAARSRHPVVLETFTERAAQFYLRNGFHLLLDDVEPVSGIRFWALRHPTPP